MSANRRRQKRGLISYDDLEKIKHILNYIYTDHYQDISTFPRFEECFAPLSIEKKINFPEAYSEMLGEKKKYLTLRRMIKFYLNFNKKEINYSENTINLYNLLFNSIFKKEGEFIGKELNNSISYSSKNFIGHKTISSIAVITDKKNKEISGLQIIYDDIFVSNLFFGNLNKLNIGLLINLNIKENLPDELNKKFPDKNQRDGILNILGTYTDHITFIGFKSRLGKILVFGKPEGKPFLFGENGKQLSYIKLSIKNNHICYLEPHFNEIDRINPYLSIKSSQVNEDFLNEDKLLYEENFIQKTINNNNINDKKKLELFLLPLINDENFKKSFDNGDIRGTFIYEICNLTGDNLTKEDVDNAKKTVDKINIEDEVKHYNNFNVGLKKNIGIFNINAIGFQTLKPVMKKIENTVIDQQENNKVLKIKDYLTNAENFENFIKNLRKKIIKDIGKSNLNNSDNHIHKIEEEEDDEEEKKNINNKNEENKNEEEEEEEEKEKIKTNNTNKNNINNIINEDNNNNNNEDNKYDINNIKLINDNNNIINKSKTESTKDPIKKKDTNDYTNFFKKIAKEFAEKKLLSNENNNPFNQLKNRKKNRGKTEEIKTRNRKSNFEKEITKEDLIYNKWKLFSKKLSKSQGLNLLQTIGAVIKGIHLLKYEEEGKKSLGISNEKAIKLLNILKENKKIILMLSKAHTESLRRKKEIEDLIKLDEELALKHIEDKKKEKVEEEKKKEELKRKEIENKINNEINIINNEREKREKIINEYEKKIENENNIFRKKNLEEKYENIKKDDIKKKEDENKKLLELKKNGKYK